MLPAPLRPLPDLARPTAARLRSGRAILLATDGSAPSDAAAAVAAALAGERHVAVDALTVLPPLSTPITPLEGYVAPVMSDAELCAQRERRRQEIGGRILAATRGRGTWRIDVQTGSPPAVIAREARRREPQLVVMGLRRHGVLDRIFRDETTLQVIRDARVPVLAVTPSLTALPRRIVVAVDFSRASLRAARAALSVAADDATLLLVHVQPNLDFSAERSEGLGVLYSQGVAAGFARLRKELDAPSGVTIEPVFLEGDAAAELLSFATRGGADLIAVGSHRHGVIDRMLLGSVTTALVRDARCSLLVTPPHAAVAPPLTGSAIPA